MLRVRTTVFVRCSSDAVAIARSAFTYRSWRLARRARVFGRQCQWRSVLVAV